MIELETVIGRLKSMLWKYVMKHNTHQGQGYPYATGFAMSAMQGSLESLVKLKKQFTESDYD